MMGLEQRDSMSGQPERDPISYLPDEGRSWSSGSNKRTRNHLLPDAFGVREYNFVEITLVLYHCWWVRYAYSYVRVSSWPIRK